ncbi:UDP-N-acetylenolpyruvoylglucosamine reductase [Iodidimonas muriae]|uniref:UDP-N-acetylenolpyruvoylglucosamine reductase n=1 Tax=Iodidimonas muriae TaxID=261467 RepID=A0ABQ2LC10_9PROT|nr:UDP-N-acetylmuramate dehydrogenase [Iodidimonas muriae]GER06804.1 UDP-N-acetylenolpyruvoylglucosamine reductase [Kordiimonadales bacterium JCM 17843]GGO09921.1 UDP-N-acetylenolpyruvoylglucosamine reductase [Iodidimonas muriae]
MMAAHASSHWTEDLPPLKGRLEANVPLARYSWFRTGGPAELFFEPADQDDLCALLGTLPADVPLTVLGVGSNILIRDGGVDGLVIRLGKAMGQIARDGDCLMVGAGASDFAVAHAARDYGLSGLEFLRGVPGSIGGAVRMNAGAYGVEMADILVDACIMDRFGHIRNVACADLDFSYRHSGLSDRDVVVSARLRGVPGDRERIEARMAEISKAREDAQPLRSRTGGSTFKNPPGMKAWELIDRAGCRGMTLGGAQISEKHTNFLINTGTASSGDLEDLGEMVRQCVADQCGVTLDWEIRRIGKRAGGAR